LISKTSAGCAHAAAARCNRLHSRKRLSLAKEWARRLIELFRSTFPLLFEHPSVALIATMSYAAQREKLVKLMEKEVEADGGGAAAPYRAPRATRVKNKQPAPVQISAEQIIREANERQDVAAKAPTQRITDPEELAEYRLTRRKEFEDMVRRARFSINVWVKYAQWEESQFELERARSIWERALNIEPRNLNLWLKLAEMEMRHRNINRARNVWDRAVQLLPRHDQLWYKYAYMEEQLGNYAGCRQVFERWMQWEPPMQAWQTYVNFEMRYNEKDRARSIYQRMVSVHPTVDAWLKYAKYEEKYGIVDSTREVYEAAVDRLEEHVVDEELFLAFARFETRSKEVERARAIYKYALDCIPKAQASTLYSAFVQFEKQHGDRKGVEDVIIAKRRFKYEGDIKADSLNYDVWFDYIRLEEAEGEVDRARELFERAIAQVPSSFRSLFQPPISAFFSCRTLWTHFFPGASQL
jgi:crooked neck